jgi:hypothetical protein
MLSVVTVTGSGMVKGSFGGGGGKSPAAMNTAAWRWYSGASTETVSESLSKVGRRELFSKSPGFETGLMESATDAATIDPATDAAAVESASSSRADSSST